ncbi:uncharacterized protein LOC116425848 [Nomia melanderi]|uniref:uncharacterized protein LOC116425848 n=1 Tax=Nomia melanderi TaxID=2448451 RepID=UPI003FCD8093
MTHSLILALQAIVVCQRTIRVLIGLAINYPTYARTIRSMIPVLRLFKDYRLRLEDQFYSRRWSRGFHYFGNMKFVVLVGILLLMGESVLLHPVKEDYGIYPNIPPYMAADTERRTDQPLTGPIFAMQPISIIVTPLKKCPEGQQLDPAGKCQKVIA